ncbi:hypothetical protein ACMGT0_15885 [Pseudomonas sp. RHF3.3-3]|uniref:hypothetical protein n=1 Tax=Pseudomonas sp. RHF3.3-3 TaxID=3396624 RepID=UPI003A87E2A8
MISYSLMMCERCGGELVAFKEGSTGGMKCLACGWSLVATDIHGIKLDDKDYEVFCFGDYKNKNHVMAVSKASGCNFLESREGLRQGEFLAFCGKAIDILKVFDDLVDAGLKCSIKPDFIWAGRNGKAGTNESK